MSTSKATFSALRPSGVMLVSHERTACVVDGVAPEIVVEYGLSQLSVGSEKRIPLLPLTGYYVGDSPPRRW
jgi:hypothetical protein